MPCVVVSGIVDGEAGIPADYHWTEGTRPQLAPDRGDIYLLRRPIEGAGCPQTSLAKGKRLMLHSCHDAVPI